ELSLGILESFAEDSNTFWELCYLEHGILPDSKILSGTAKEGGVNSFHTFRELDSGRQRYEVLTGPYHQLVHSQQLIISKEGAVSNYADQHDTIIGTLTWTILES
ncbi:hypothetical protein U0070_001585, partial [Myodes glareolus]